MCGDVLQASLGTCNVPGPSVATGAAVITLPSPTAILQFSSTSPYLACTGSAATLSPISAPPSTSLTATVRLSDGSQRELSDARAHFNIEGPCMVTRDQHTAPVVSVLPSSVAGLSSSISGCTSDTCTITLTYPTLNKTLQEVLNIPIVEVESILVLPQLYDAPAACILPPNGTLADLAASAQDSAAANDVQLAPLACSLQDYQQATVCVIAQLTNQASQAVNQTKAQPLTGSFPSHVDVSAYATLQVSDDSQVSTLQNLVDTSVPNRIRPHEAGMFNVTALFGSVESTALSVTAATSDNAVHVQSIKLEFSPQLQGSSSESSSQNECGYQCQRTISGPRTTSRPLLATVTLSDSFKYSPGTLLGASNTANDIVNVSRIFSCASNQPDAVSVSALGDLSLLDNAAEAVVIEVWKKECPSNAAIDPSPATSSATLEVFANLEAAMLDVDVGEMFGPPLQLQTGNDSSFNASEQAPRPLEVSSLPIHVVLYCHASRTNTQNAAANSVVVNIVNQVMYKHSALPWPSLL